MEESDKKITCVVINCFDSQNYNLLIIWRTRINKLNRKKLVDSLFYQYPARLYDCEYVHSDFIYKEGNIEID